MAAHHNQNGPCREDWAAALLRVCLCCSQLPACSATQCFNCRQTPVPCRYDARRRPAPNPDLLPLVQQSRKVRCACAMPPGQTGWLDSFDLHSFMPSRVQQIFQAFFVLIDSC